MADIRRVTGVRKVAYVYRMARIRRVIGVRRMADVHREAGMGDCMCLEGGRWQGGG